MDLVRAAVLGIVQGLTEFLPISSSGHLVLIRALFGWPDEGLAFDVGLHLGTMLALLAYFWRDWWEMARAGIGDIARYHLRVAEYSSQGRLPWLIALGSIPAALAGLLFDDWIERNVREPWLVAIALAVAAFVMLAADRRGERTRTMGGVAVLDAAVVGLAQACALFPGVSRSGVTMSAALFRGFDRNAAARFAFLLGTPAFAGAALLKAKDLGEAGGGTSELVVGFAVSAVVGFAAIHFLLRFLRTHSLVPFVIYRLVVAALALAISGLASAGS